MRTRLPTSLLIALLAFGLAACGSSSTAPGVVTAPGGGATTTVVATTSTPAALKTKPVVSVPKTPPPKSLVIKDLVTGTGQAVQPGQTVTVNYVGVLYKTGKEFDSSWSRNQALTTALASGPSGVIEGWVKGIPGMRVGGRRELIIPPSLGYKAAGSPPTIPPNATLIFVIDLLAVS